MGQGAVTSFYGSNAVYVKQGSEKVLSYPDPCLGVETRYLSNTIHYCRAKVVGRTLEKDGTWVKN
jgi:hypothetical protein